MNKKNNGTDTNTGITYLKKVKKNRSAYNHFVAYTIQQINNRSINGYDKPFNELMIEVSNDWKNLDEHGMAPFKNIAEEEKRNYENYKNLKSTKKIRKIQSNYDVQQKRKRAPSAFVLYFRDVNISNKHGSLKTLSISAFSKKVSELWKIESEEVKLRYKTKVDEIKAEIEEEKRRNNICVQTSNLETIALKKEIRQVIKKKPVHQPFIQYSNQHLKNFKKSMQHNPEFDHKILCSAVLNKKLADKWNSLSLEEKTKYQSPNYQSICQL